MGEVIRAEHRGKAVGSVQSGWALGWAGAAIVATVLFSVFPSDTAWRALFWVGLLPALLVFFVRRFVDEPQVFTATQGSLKAKGATPNFLEIFSSWLLRTTILTSILATGAQGGYYAIATWLPTYLRTERKLTVLGTGGYLAVIIVGSFIGYLAGAYLADRIGRRAKFILFALCSLLTAGVYTQLPITDNTMLILGLSTRLLHLGHLLGDGSILD